MNRVAYWVLTIESVFVFGIGLYVISLGITHDKDWLPFLSVIAFTFAGAVALYALSRGVNSGKRWAYSPAILANLIALGVTKYQFEAGVYWLATPIALMAILAIGSLLLRINQISN